MQALFDEFLGILDQAAGIAASLTPAQAELSLQMPIYNRPVNIAEGLGIIMAHAGLFHTAQVAEPAGVPPLWQQLSPEIRHRVIGRTMRAFALLYRLEGSICSTCGQVAFPPCPVCSHQDDTRLVWARGQELTAIPAAKLTFEPIPVKGE